MLFNIFYSMWAYSIYLTLRELVVLWYCIMLILGIFSGIAVLIHEEIRDPLQYMGLIGNVVLLVVMLYYISRAYVLLRKGGGIKGKQDEKGMRPADYAKQSAWNDKQSQMSE